MEFSVFRQVLIRALGHMQSIVEKRATLPILMTVKIEAADDLMLSATNVDLELVEHVAADITLGGKVTVPVQMHPKSPIYSLGTYALNLLLQYNFPQKEWSV